MTRYSDAALLTGEFTHMAAELKAGKRKAPSQNDWQKASCENAGEEAAQAVAKQIFELQSAIEKKNEQLEIISMTAAGPIIVMGLFPVEGDMLRLEGLLIGSTKAVAQIIHASQLALTITKKPIAEAKPEEDAAQIGFVIFDQLEKRAAAKAKPAKKSVAKAKTNKTKKNSTKRKT